MGLNNIDFKLLSLNVRGICSFEKRKGMFHWLRKSGADICFLQETYSTKEVEITWKKQWKGDMFFSHGSSHSKGVLVLVRDNLDFNLKSVKVDELGRYILLEATIQDSAFLLQYCAKRMPTNFAEFRLLFNRKITEILGEISSNFR